MTDRRYVLMRMPSGRLYRGPEPKVPSAPPIGVLIAAGSLESVQAAERLINEADWREYFASTKHPLMGS